MFKSGEGPRSKLIEFTIKNSRAPYDGGRILCAKHSSQVIKNCVLTNNSAHFLGGGIYCSNSSPNITGCTFTHNEVSEMFQDSGSKPTMVYSNIQGGFQGKRNIDADSLFVDTPAGILHIMQGSPSMGAYELWMDAMDYNFVISSLSKN